jgi:glycolate oxidase iron-sulfur subunit
MNEKTSSSASKLHQLAFDATNHCIQCGYCLPACPTYLSMGKEAQSPRGRINLVKLAAEGKIDIKDHLSDPIDLCLGCRACEVVCPVNVPYGHILESAKEVIHQEDMSSPSTSASGMKRFVLKRLFPYPKRMRAVGNLVWIYQKSGLQRVVRKGKLLDKLLPTSSQQMEKVLPALESPSHRPNPGEIIPAKGKTKARVAFFQGCITDALLYRTNRLTVQLLSLIGCEVIIPKQQNCCGALHTHQGMKEEAKKLAKQNILAFEAIGAEYIVNNAGGCGAMLSEYGHLLSDDPDWHERAQHFAQASRDITQLLVQFGPLPYQKEWNGTITYQDSCHLRNVQKVINEPRELLRSIPGATYVELKNSDQCCASGGIYNLLHFDESMGILDEKMKEVQETKATTIVTTNPGCYLQMRLGIERAGSSDQIQGLHLVDVLAEVCGLT